MFRHALDRSLWLGWIALIICGCLWFLWDGYNQQEQARHRNREQYLNTELGRVDRINADRIQRNSRGFKLATQ